jgi:MFS family permease
MRDHPPEYYSLLPDGDTDLQKMEDVNDKQSKNYEHEFTAREALRTRSFWMMLAAFSIDFGILGMVTMHQMPYLQDIGIDPMAAAGVLGLMATMSLPGRVIFAWVGDKWGEKRTLILGYVMKAIGLIVWTTARSIPQIMLFVIIFGLGYGGTIPVRISLRASYFGRKAFATITGYSTLFMSISNIVYPIFAGWSYDLSGSYTRAFTIVIILQIVAIFFLYLTKKPTPPSPGMLETKPKFYS